MNLFSVNNIAGRLPLKWFSAAMLFFMPGAVFPSSDFPPAPSTLVADYTGTLTDSEKQALESKLSAFGDSTSTQIAVVLMQSVGDYDINDYAAQLGEKWGIGQKEKNNGVLVLAAMGDRKLSIQVGYGLEAVITDGAAKRIIETEMKPAFKEGRYYEGLNRGTDVLMSLASREFSAGDYVKKRQESFPWFLVLIFGFIMAIAVFSRVMRTRTYSARNHIPFWAAWTLLNMATRRSRGSWSDFSSGSGSFGGSSFGGFGGGSFGGGGASGSW